MEGPHSALNPSCTDYTAPLIQISAHSLFTWETQSSLLRASEVSFTYLNPCWQTGSCIGGLKPKDICQSPTMWNQCKVIKKRQLLFSWKVYICCWDSFGLNWAWPWSSSLSPGSPKVFWLWVVKNVGFSLPLSSKAFALRISTANFGILINISSGSVLCFGNLKYTCVGSFAWNVTMTNSMFW